MCVSNLSSGMRPQRILHCPWNVAGQSAQLAAAQRELGADSRCVVIEETALGFPADEVLAPPRPSISEREKARWRLLSRAVSWADVVHFSFGQSCLVPHAFPSLRLARWANPLDVVWRLYCRAVWLKDLPLLSAMGKTLAVTWQGDDARQRDRSLELFDISIANAVTDEYYPPYSDDWKRRTIAAFSRHAPLHYALNPDLLHVLPKQARFQPYASFDPAGVAAVPPLPVNERPLVFLHAPSHRGAKGTEFVLAAAEMLKAEGHAFELRLVEGLPRAEALKAYASADVVIDQLLAGWYGGFGVEAMALGKPVIAHLREGDLGFLDPEMRAQLPIIDATPASIAGTMRSVIAMERSVLHAMGLAARAFVERWHDPRRLAAQTLADYEAVRTNRAESAQGGHS
jgi:glycosyltransferase involved in cell wall biosynthesis